MRVFLKVMKALSDPNRVKVLKMLEGREMCVCEIHTALDVAQSTASKHLKILEDAGLIRSSRDGLWVNYRLADGTDNPYADLLLGGLKHWLNDDAEIRELKARLPGIRRESILVKDKVARGRYGPGGRGEKQQEVKR